VRPGAGRKPKPLAEKRRNRVVIHLTDEEHEQVTGAAGDEQLSTFLRRIIFRALARRR